MALNPPPLKAPPGDSRWTQYDDQLHQAIFGAAPSVHTIQSGTTAQRPTSGVSVGSMYQDSTLGKPIWVKSLAPIVWMDATGGIV